MFRRLIRLYLFLSVHTGGLTEKEKQAIDGEQQAIEWGSQIRSYVFQPYTLVKDNRSGVETGNIQAVMDGELDVFIEGFLKYNKLQK